MLEGVAAFVVEGERLIREWDRFKRAGAPRPQDVVRFRDGFGRLLLQAHFGSRIGEKTGVVLTGIPRTNVSTLLKVFAKQAGDSFWEPYEWLCDAVHPSFGFSTAYVATQGRHVTGATFAAELARRAHTARVQAPRIDPTVARAAGDATVIAVEQCLEELPRIRWLLDDLGLTSGAAHALTVPSMGTMPTPERNDRCPCGSGRKFKLCVHSWSLPGLPPSPYVRAPEARPPRACTAAPKRSKPRRR